MASPNASRPDLPNPLTPFAWFTPDIEHQLIVGHSILFGVLGAWIWDSLTSLTEEVQMFVKCGLRLPDIVYLLSRLSTGWLIFLALLPGVMPAGHCHEINKSVGWAAAVQFSSNALLFFFRVRAVFHDQKPVVAVFAALWLAIVGTSILYPVTFDGTNVGTTQVCIGSRLSVGSSVVVIVTAVNDTLTFFAITVKLLMTNTWGTKNSPWSSWSKIFITGEGMGDVSRMMMQTGQLYYLVTVGFTITSAAMILTPSIPMGYSDAMMPVSACVTNMMATLVYRRLKLGLFQDTPSPSMLTSSMLGQTLEFRRRSLMTTSGQMETRQEASVGVFTAKTVTSDSTLEWGKATTS